MWPAWVNFHPIVPFGNTAGTSGRLHRRPLNWRQLNLTIRRFFSTSYRPKCFRPQSRIIILTSLYGTRDTLVFLPPGRTGRDSGGVGPETYKHSNDSADVLRKLSENVRRTLFSFAAFVVLIIGSIQAKTRPTTDCASRIPSIRTFWNVFFIPSYLSRRTLM